MRIMRIVRNTIAPPGSRRPGLRRLAWRGADSELAMQTAGYTLALYAAFAIGGSFGFLFASLCYMSKAADEDEPR
jgi:hypothetical protein